ncbi:MAG TPA: serine/threonine-protein kinase [Vicinamibacteria bacterium]|nr:serine/threonine-protein kinase [Vicinamibacteria bacterium]
MHNQAVLKASGMICPECNALNDDQAESCFTCGRSLASVAKGSVIAGRYEVLRPLGKGGMGMVYQAHDRMLDETVAIKVLRSEFVNTPEMAQRFRSEIKLARRVTHRNVCRIHEYGEDPGGPRYISMEYVEGADLRELTRERGGFIPAEEAYELAAQAADGLQAIHEVGIIHRDLKTSNIMRDSRGVVRLMDFGIAKVETDHATSAGLTSAGQVMGTPEYMSPEQCMGTKLDARSDIYALGIVIYEMFTGTVPFRGDTPVATLFRHMQDPVPFDSGPAARIPRPAVPVLGRALAKQRADRYQSASELAEALRRARQQTASGGATVDSPTTPMRMPAASGPQPGASGLERRASTRLDIFVNLVLRRVGTGGTVLQEERTIAENVGRGGARVLTTMGTLVPGDIVQIEEIGGSFKTRAEVRGRYVGHDGIRRLNLKFLDRQAPDYLVHVDTD